MKLSQNIITVDINEERSSLVKKLEYWPDEYVLSVYLRHGKPPYCMYEDVTPDFFDELVKARSVGKMYLNFIKPHFKKLNYQTMAERPKTQNLASNKKRFIKISINVQEIIKEWIFAGEKGNYLNMTLQLLPDGETDKVGNLGMVTQDPPKAIFEKEKALPKDQRTRGPILGNGCEFVPFAMEGSPGTETGNTLSGDAIDDLPF